MTSAISIQEKIKQLLFLTILTVGTMAILNSNSANAQSKNLTPPPYVARNSNSMGIQFRIMASDAAQLLPEGIIPKVDENGMVVGGIESYTTDQIYGIPNFSISFITIEVKDINQLIGNNGNWVVWGAIDNKEALEHFKHFFNLPFYLEEKIEFQKTENNQSLIVGNQLIELTLSMNSEKVIKAEGLANNFTKTEGGQILKTKIPWLADGYSAEVVYFKINSGGNETLRLLENAKPFFSLLSKNTFSYTAPELDN